MQMNEWARIDYLWDRGRDARGTRGASARRRAGCDAAIGDGRAGRQATHVGPGDGGRTGHRRASKSDDGALLEEETYFPSVEHRANNEHSGLSSLFARTKAIFSVLRSVDWSPRDFFCQVINSDVEHRAYGQLD